MVQITKRDDLLSWEKLTLMSNMSLFSFIWHHRLPGYFVKKVVALVPIEQSVKRAMLIEQTCPVKVDRCKRINMSTTLLYFTMAFYR